MTNNPFMQNPQMPGSPMNAPLPGATASSASDSYEIDLTGVQENSYTIPDGNYRVKCVEVEQTVSKGGNPMFVWTFEVSEGDYRGFETKVFTAITPAAMWKVAETVVALGVGQSGSVVKFKRSDVVGKECGVTLEASEYNGTTRSSVVRTMTLKELAEGRQ